MPSIFQLTYISSRHPAMAPEEVERILSISRIRNASCGLTGLLLFNGHRFLQHLEGRADAVEETFARISRDPRHRAIVVLGRREETTRSFPRWHMAYERAAGGEASADASLVDQVEALVAGADPKVASHFLGYARLTGGKAA